MSIYETVAQHLKKTDLKETYNIKIAEKLKINRIGKDLLGFGFFFLIIFGVCLLPAKYLPFEISTIYLFEVVPHIVYIVLSGAIIIILIGEWLRGMRKYDKAELILEPQKIILISQNKNIELEYDKIKKFRGVMNLFHGYKRLNFVIKMADNNKYEIRADSEIYDGLTDYFPDKN